VARDRERKVLGHLVCSSPGTAVPIFCNARGNTLTRDGAAYLIEKYVLLAAPKITGLHRRQVTPHVFSTQVRGRSAPGRSDITVIRGRDELRRTPRRRSASLRVVDLHAYELDRLPSAHSLALRRPALA
jgi:hypothetical protein